MRPAELLRYAEWPGKTVDAFKAALPLGGRVLADVFLAVGQRTAVSPLAIDSLVRRESGYGAYLKPKGYAGTGDFAPRKRKARPERVTIGVTVKEEGGAFVLYPPGWPNRGWGYGLTQWDFDSFSAEIGNLDWGNPLVNVEVGIKDILLAKVRFFRIPENAVEMKKYATDERGVARGMVDEDLLARAAFAAYNTGQGNVMRSLRAGRDVDSTTADGPDEDKDGDYSRDVIAHAFETAAKMGLA